MQYREPVAAGGERGTHVRGPGPRGPNSSSKSQNTGNTRTVWNWEPTLLVTNLHSVYNHAAALR